MDKIIITAKTYDDAITKALIELGTTQDNIEITVLERGTNGLFGIFGAKPCKIEVKVIQRVDDFELLKRESRIHSDQLIHSLNSLSDTKKTDIKKPVEESKKEVSEKKNIPSTVKEQNKKRNEIGNTQLQEDISDEVEASSVLVEDVQGSGIIPLSEEDALAITKNAENFVSELLRTMNFDIQITSSFDYKTNEINLLLNSDEDMGIIIGKRGQTLDSIQYITSLVVNKSTSQYVRVKLDAQGYRGKRKDKLETLANSVAMKVKRFRKPISLEPMNPYERRIIHSTLQNHPYITTKSEGEEPNRFITILPKNNFNKNRFNRNFKSKKPHDRNYRSSQG